VIEYCNIIKIRKGATHLNNEEKIFNILVNLETKVDKIEQGQARLETRFDKLEVRVEDIHHSVAKIEEEHGRKLGALLDGYEQLNTRTLKIMSDVESIKDTLEDHDLRLKVSEHRYAGAR
jgi:predicted  nucleic acid-binding Zn-ribbon protein